MLPMLRPDETALVIVDVQGKLAQLMHEKDALIRNIRIAVQGAQILNIPLFWLEQNPAGLGPTLPEVAELLGGRTPITKMSFSACGSPAFVEALKACGRRQVLVAGIEAHVCICLTAADLLSMGYHVEILEDAVSSRSPENKRIGIARAQEFGAGITCVETALFELLGSAEAQGFKEIIRLLK
jgi:nicotinamidase-related amidase